MLKKIFLLFISIFSWSFFLVCCIVLFPIALLVWLINNLFGKKSPLLFYFTKFWAYVLILHNPLWRLKIKNNCKAEKYKQYIIVSNHQSLLDILILYSLNYKFKWVAKKELFSVPIVGWLLRLNKDIPIDRGNKLSAQLMMEDAERKVKQGWSIIIFPEGTRSVDAEVKNFKDGAFKMAKNFKLPILPVMLDGSANAIPKHSLMIKGIQKMSVTVLDPIEIDEVENLSISELSAKCKVLITEALKECRVMSL
jgi:1-acyl-sn-glycerol-3-phosphate acyltransferase